jgi:hypothetical protein
VKSGAAGAKRASVSTASKTAAVLIGFLVCAESVKDRGGGLGKASNVPGEKLSQDTLPPISQGQTQTRLAAME